MKSFSTLFAFFLLINIPSFSTTTSPLELRKMIHGGGINYQVVGEATFDMKAAFFAHFQKKEKRNYIWKFRNVMVPGLDEKVTFQVHQGLYGTKEPCATSCPKGGSYFNTFVNERYKEKREAQALENEQPGLLIYIKRGRDRGVSQEESVFVEKFLDQVYDQYTAAQ